MKAHYRLVIVYGMVFALALLASAAALFTLKTGFSPAGIREYYGAKTLYGLTETARPHLFAMGAFIMVIGHFFLFTPFKRKVIPYLKTLYLAAFATIATSYAAASWGMAGSLLKWVSVSMLIVLSLVVVGGLMAAASEFRKTVLSGQIAPDRD